MRKLVSLLLATAALPALAHPGHGGDVSFFSGFAHPLGGLDHLLAMLAVGVWSALHARRIWLAPASFAALLLVGAMLAANGWAPPAVEPMIAASLLVMGLLIATRQSLAAPLAAALIGGFALFHGAAHGSELAVGAAPVAGMLSATLLLHALGVMLGLGAKRNHLHWQQLAGAGIALAGLGLASGML